MTDLAAMQHYQETGDLSAFEPELARPTDIIGQYESFLLYGRGGTGKTFTAGTAPDPFWILTMGGRNEAKTLFSPVFIKKYGRKEFYITSVTEDRFRARNIDDPTGYDRCCLAVDAFLEWNHREGLGVKTIIVDNATRIEEYMMNKAIMAEYTLASNKEQTVRKAEMNLGIRKPYDSTYGGAQSLMEQWTNWLTELPFHLVFIAHTYEEWQQKERSRERQLISVKPLFVGQQRTNVPNKFDNLWYHKVQGGGRSRTWGVQSERDEIVDARTRVGGILDPTYERDINLSDVIAEFSKHAKNLEEQEKET